MTTLRPTTSIPIPDLPQLQATLTSLQTAAHILAGLTHRNKNQHRGTKWWTPFAMLRRSLHKLIPDLEGAITRAELVPPSASSSKRKKATATAPPVKTAKQPELERVVERAVWLKEVLGGRAYEAFTQLAADRQFAQLGLLLIGVLAQVEAAIAPLIPAEPEPEVEENSVTMKTERGAEILREAVPSSTDFDLGVAVSREEVLAEDDDDRHRSRKPPALPTATLQLPKEMLHAIRSKEGKRKKPMADESDGGRWSPSQTRRFQVSPGTGDGSPTAKDMSTDPILSTPAKKLKRRKLDIVEPSRAQETRPMSRAEETTQEAQKSKKKKKKGGDEFDDLFSSLL